MESLVRAKRRARSLVAGLVSMLAGCVHFGVVGIEPRTDGEPELEIVGPAATDPASCEHPRFVDEPTTPYAIDHRCAAYIGHR
jgi:hypothetical protein